MGDQCSDLEPPVNGPLVQTVETTTERAGKTERERRYYLSSASLDAKAFAVAVRAHWGIENRLHWVLNVVFHDDLARLRSGNGPQNMVVVKHVALNLIRILRTSTASKPTLARLPQRRLPRKHHPKSATVNLKRFPWVQTMSASDSQRRSNAKTIRP